MKDWFQFSGWVVAVVLGVFIWVNSEKIFKKEIQKPVAVTQKVTSFTTIKVLLNGKAYGYDDNGGLWFLDGNKAYSVKTDTSSMVENTSTPTVLYRRVQQEEVDEIIGSMSR